MKFEMDKSKQQSSQNGVSRRTGLTMMTLVLLLAFAFGANGLNTDPIWTDELFSVANIGGFDPPYSPAQIIESIAEHSRDHVPLFYLLGAGWAHLVGWSQFALRLFSALAGVLMIAWLYRLGTDMFNRRTGLAAAMLMSTSAYMILYVHDFRMYTLLLMFTIMHTWLYWRLTHGYRATRLTWCLFVTTASAMVYTQLFSMIWFAGLGLYHLAFAARSRRKLQVILGWMTGGILFLPYFPRLISAVQYASGNFNVTGRAASATELIRTCFYLLANGSGILFVLLVGVLAFALWRKRDAAVIKFMLMTLAMMTLIVLLNEGIGLIPITRMRYFLILWIPVMLLFAWGLGMMPRWPWIAVGCLLIWGAASYQFYRSDDILTYASSMTRTRVYPPMQNYVYHLQGKVRSADYLLGFTLMDYVNRDLKHGKSAADFYTQLHLGIDGAFIQHRNRPDWDWLTQDVRDKINRHPYLLLTYDPQNKHPQFDGALNRIETDYVACDVVVDEPNLFVQRYVHALIGCEREGYAPIAYDNGVMLVDRFAKYNEDTDTVQILTGWEVEDESLLHEYNVSLQIITPDWQSTGRPTDRHLYEEDILKWYEAELSTDGLPPGDYRVMVIVYDRETNKKVHGIDLNSGASTDIFPILTFTIGSE